MAERPRKKASGRPHSTTRKSAANTRTNKLNKSDKDSDSSTSCYTEQSTTSSSFKSTTSTASSIEPSKTKHTNDDTYDHMPAYIVEIGGKKIDLSDSSQNDRKLMISETTGKHLPLETLGEDLSRLGKLVHLAYCGVTGHTDLEIKARKVLVNVGDITNDTYHTLIDFERASNSALETMQIAYGFLKENLEGEALNMFKQIRDSSTKMCEIANKLSEKCKSESEKVNELGEETARAKADTEEKKKEADRLIDKSRRGEQSQQEKLQAARKESDRKGKVVANTLDDEKKVFDKKAKLAKQYKEKKEAKIQEVQKHKRELKLKYDAACNEVEDKIEKTQQEFQTAILSGQNAYETKLKEFETTLKEKIDSAEKAYEKEVQKIEEEFKEAKRENERSYENKIKQHKEKYDKTVSDAEKDYNFTTSQAEKDYHNEIRASDEEYNKILSSATQRLDTVLEANRQLYSTKAKACWTDKGKAEVHEVWSERDADQKRDKIATESNARSDRTRAHNRAHENRDNKISRAYRDKNNKIDQAEKDMNQNVTEALEEVKKLNEQAMSTKTEQLNAAESKKIQTISTAQKLKQENEQKVKDTKEMAENSAREVKETEDQKNKSHKESLLQKYELDITQDDNELAKAEKQFEDDYQKELRIMDDEFKHLKETSSKYESEIKDHEKEREEAFQQMLLFAEQLKNSIKSSEGHETSRLCLEKAKTALNQIGVIMSRAGSFWLRVGKHCEDITEGGLSKQLKVVESSKDSLSRKKIYNTKVFKAASLKYAGQWLALKNASGTANEHIALVQEEIEGYLCENPTREEALEIVEKLATDILHSRKSSKMISNKPENT